MGTNADSPKHRYLEDRYLALVHHRSKIGGALPNDETSFGIFVTATRDVQVGESYEGWLACTSERLVYFAGEDISPTREFPFDEIVSVRGQARASGGQFAQLSLRSGETPTFSMSRRNLDIIKRAVRSHHERLSGDSSE